MLLLAIVIAGAIVWAGGRIASEISRSHRGGAPDRTLDVLSAAAPAVAGAEAGARALLAWHPLVRALAALHPAEMGKIEQACGDEYPFSADRILAAHARWTTEWLEWERSHDAETKLKAVLLEDELSRSAAPDAVRRARLDALEREKLDSYQRRYGEYVRISKALQALTRPSARP